MKNINRITWRSKLFVGQREILFYLEMIEREKERERVCFFLYFISFLIVCEIKKEKRSKKASDSEVRSGGASPRTSKG
jgi:hypothetical protein